MSQSRTTLAEVNSHLLCVLCGGYFIDATTICECLHSFCRACIVKHLESSRFCPICDVQLHKSRPLSIIRPDHTLQRLVYKVVPGLYQSELRRRKDFYRAVFSKLDAEGSERARADLHKDLSVMGHYQVFSPEDRICISLEYYDSNSKSEETKADDKTGGNSQEIPVRYLQCPAPFTVQSLKKFLKQKYQLRHDHKVDIYYQGKMMPDYFSLIDVAHFFNWDRMNPMKFGFQLLERHAVVVNNATRVMVTESYPSSSQEESPLQTTKSADSARSDKSSQKVGMTLGKKKSREHTVEETTPLKKSRNAQSLPNRRKLLGLERKRSLNKREKRNSDVDRVTPISVEERENNNDSKSLTKYLKPEESQPSSQLTASAATANVQAMDVEEVSQAIDPIEEDSCRDASQDIEEVVIDTEDGEPSQDFVLQEVQTMDISEDLEEDDDEDRLRICDPEEVPEEKTEEESPEENTEVNVKSGSESPIVNVQVEEDTGSAKRDGKSRKKNKKSKHHHRHKRDYSPAPEATIVSGDKNDLLKLKVKLTRPDNDSRHHRPSGNHSPRHSKHQNHTVEESPIQSPSIDEDSRHSQSTDDHDTRSIGSSKEGQDDEPKSTPVLNGITKSQQISTKEKLLQMRQFRPKNVTPPPSLPPPRAPLSTTISKVSAEEANRNNQKSPILLPSSNSSLTVSKVTAEERLKMMNNNNLGSTKPSLEIIMVNKPNSVKMTRESTMIESQKQKSFPPGTPVVKLEKSSHLNNFLMKQNAESLAKAKSSEASKKADESHKSRDDKNNSDKTRPVENKKSESFGVLDLSGKSTRSCGSSPNSEGSCSSPKQTAVSMNQPLINRHLSSMNSPHRSNSNSPPVPVPISKASPNRSNMWNLMTLSNTAVQLQNMKASQAQEAMKRQLMNNQKKPSPRASPTPLKIPTPNMSMNNKFVNRPKVPGNPNPLVNNVRPASKPVTPQSRAMSSNTPSRPITSFPNMHQSQSAAVAKKQAGINGRNPNIPPPPPAIPISALYKMESMAENMARKYEIVKIARGLSAASKAAAGIHSS